MTIIHSSQVSAGFFGFVALKDNVEHWTNERAFGVIRIMKILGREREVIIVLESSKLMRGP